MGFKLVMKEVNSFRGIPYSDYFSVVTEWVVVALPPASTTAAAPTCKATVYLDFEFHKYTWLQGTIDSNTKAELIEVYELWLESAQESLRKALDRKMSTLSTLHALNESLKGVDNDNDDMELAPLQLDLEAGRASEAEGELAVSDGERSHGAGNGGGEGKRRGSRGGDSGTPSAPTSGGSTPGMLVTIFSTYRAWWSATSAHKFYPYFSDITFHSPPIHFAARRSRSYENSDGSGYPSDEELQFFDCEEEGNGAQPRGSAKSRASKGSNLLSPELLRFYQQDAQEKGYVNSYGDLNGLEESTIGGMESSRGAPNKNVRNVRTLSGMSAYPPHIGGGQPRRV